MRDLDDEAYLIAVGRRIRLLRVAAGLTQGILAERAGVTRNWLSAIERATQRADLARVNRLALAFGITLTELLDDDPGVFQRLIDAQAVVIR